MQLKYHPKKTMQAIWYFIGQRFNLKNERLMVNKTADTNEDWCKRETIK